MKTAEEDPEDRESGKLREEVEGGHSQLLQVPETSLVLFCFCELLISI